MRMPHSTDFVSSVPIQWVCDVVGHMRSITWVCYGAPEQRSLKNLRRSSP